MDETLEPSDVETRIIEALKRERPGPSVEERRAFERLHGRVLGAKSGPLQLDRYILLDRLGAGGVGVVHVAYDPELDRKVAVKLVQFKGGRERRAEGQARLQREAQAMAKLAHPNVVRVYDVGSYEEGDLAGAGTDLTKTADLPAQGVFVVMELVTGQDLRHWCRAEPRSRGEILDAYRQAGHGLAEAHRAGLIHRDFKPSNVLMGEDGRARVLDFGLARVLDSVEATPTPTPTPAPDRPPRVGDVDPLSGRVQALDTPLTQTGALMGTPAYMAPEQHAGGAVDARADQFAFCAALFEALYGVRPFPGRTAKELEQSKLSDQPAPVARDQRLPARQHAAVLRGLRADPVNRFESMAPLLRELERDPIRTRNRALALGGIVSLTAAAVFFAARTGDEPDPCATRGDRLAGVWDATTVNRSAVAFEAIDKPYAADVWRTVERELDAYTGRWADASVAACRAARDDGTGPQARARQACLEAGLAQIATVSRMLQEADVITAEHAVDAIGALPSIDACATADGSEVSVLPTNDPALVELGSVEALRLGAKIEPARRIASGAVERARALGDAGVEAVALVALGRVQQTAKESQVAADTLWRASLAAEQVARDDLAAVALVEHAHALLDQNKRFDQAGRALARARAKLERGSPGDLLRADLAHAEGRLMRMQLRHREALERAQRGHELRVRALGERHPKVAESLTSLGFALHKRGRFRDAADAYDRALSIWKETVGPDHPRVGSTLRRMGITAWRQGHLDQALSLSEASMEIDRSAYHPRDQRVASGLEQVGSIYNAMNRPREALERKLAALEIMEAIFGPGHPSQATTLGNIGGTYLQMGEIDGAERYFLRAEAAVAGEHGADHPSVAWSQVGLGEVAMARGDAVQARERYGRAMALLERIYEKSHHKVLDMHRRLAEVSVALGERERAISRLELALDLHEPGESDTRVLGRLQLGLARALGRQESARAVQLAIEARNSFAKSRWGDEGVAEANALLAELPNG